MRSAADCLTAGGPPRALGRSVSRGDPAVLLAARRGAEQQAAAEAAAAAQAAAERAAQLQRAKQRQRVENPFAEEDDHLQLDDDSGSDGDADIGSSSQQHAACRRACSSQRPTPTLSHAQRRLRFEQNFRDYCQLGLKHRMMRSALHAAFQQQDHERQLAVAQQRIHDYAASGAPHPDCCGSVVVVSWRLVFLRSFLGTGLLNIPTFRLL